LKTFTSIFVTLLIPTAVVAGLKLSSILLVAQASQPAAGAETALLKAFVEIRPIDAHTHIYKADPKISALIDRLNLSNSNPAPQLSFSFL
jgi:hypothetical protein